MGICSSNNNITNTQDSLPRQRRQRRHKKVVEAYTTTDYELLAATNEISKFSLKGQEFLGKVVDVYDGDSCKIVIRVKGVLEKFDVRMYGYDSPELKLPKNDRNREAKKAKALEAKKFLEEKVLNKLVKIHCDDFDKYGRILGTIYANKTDEIEKESVNADMIREGHGYEYFGGTKRK